MSIINNSVILFKAQKDKNEIDEYEKLLNSNNYVVKQVNTLIFKFHDLTNLKNKLEKSDNYSGILLSSPRCVEAVYLALNENQLDSSWKEKNNYVVGETTHLLALQKLGINCKGKLSGNAKNLSEIIIAENNNVDKPFLFPHGNLKTDTLKIELGKSNISIDGELVYDTLDNPNIKEDFEIATKNYSEMPEFMVFFSPSGVDASINLLKKKPEILDKIQFIAIGPVTAERMFKRNLKMKGISSKPNAEEVLKVMQC